MVIGKKLLLATCVFAISSLVVGAESELVSQSSKDFRLMLFGFCIIVSVIVFSVLFYSTVYHRKSENFAQSNFHKKLGTEVVWILLPISMLVGMALPSAFNVIGLDGLGEFKKQAYAARSGDGAKEEVLKNRPKTL